MSRSRLGAAIVLGAGIVVVAGVFAGGFRDHAALRLAAGLNGAAFVEMGGGVHQRWGNDCGPAALAHAIRLLGIPAPYPDPGATVVLTRRGCRFGDLGKECHRYGVVARIVRVPFDRLDEVEPPAILYLKRGHFVVFEGWRAGHAVIHDPAIGRVEYERASLARRWRGEMMVFPTESRPATVGGTGDSPREGAHDGQDQSEGPAMGRAHGAGLRFAGARIDHAIDRQRRGGGGTQLESLRSVASPVVEPHDDLRGDRDGGRVLLTQASCRVAGRDGPAAARTIGPPG